MIDVTCIGDINVDIVTSKIGDVPPRDSQILVEDMGLSSGGCCANFSKALSRLGAEVRFIGRVGDDLFGDFVRQSMEGIDLRLSVGGKTGITVAIAFDVDSRSFITFPGSNSELSFGDIDLDLIEGRCLHVASFFLQGLREKTKELIDFAHSRDMFVSFDTGWDPRGWSGEDKKIVEDVLGGVDVFFPNLAEGEAITGSGDKKTICDELLDLGTRIVALKCGKDGSFIATKDDYFFVPAFKVDAVDTTGAGDVFDAGLIYGYLEGWDLEKVGRFASAAAALSTRGRGSGNYPVRVEVEQLMSELNP